MNVTYESTLILHSCGLYIYITSCGNRSNFPDSITGQASNVIINFKLIVLYNVWMDFQFAYTITSLNNNFKNCYKCP